MILSFTVSNFTSIRDPVTLNLAAENLKDAHPENIAFPGDGKIGVLKTAGVYGANASGKSNLFKAILSFWQMIMGSSDWKLDKEIPDYEPFRLDADSCQKPCEMEMEFIGPENRRYIYKFAFTRYEITLETLDFYPGARPVNLFYREKTENGELKFKPGNCLKGKIRAVPCLKNNLYLSKAANTEGGPEIVKDVYLSINERLIFFNQHVDLAFLGESFLTDTGYLDFLSLLLSCGDTGITGVKFEEMAVPDRVNTSEGIDKNVKGRISRQPVFIHQGVSSARFKLNDQSNGTRRLYILAPYLLWALKIGGSFIIDELDNSLHPHISEFLVRLFNDPETNPRNAQLIFTTHDSSLMNQDYMRRDQLWFTRKNEKGATELFSLDEFKDARSSSPFAKWYLEGRLDAVPVIDFKRFKEGFKGMISP